MNKQSFSSFYKSRFSNSKELNFEFRLEKKQEFVTSNDVTQIPSSTDQQSVHSSFFYLLTDLRGVLALDDA